MIRFNHLFLLLCMLCISTFAFAQQPANNNCTGAIDLSSSLGQGADNTIHAGEYDNTEATTESSDPTTGFECFGEQDSNNMSTPSLDNTLWFKIIGDGNEYYIEATSTGCDVEEGLPGNDTQMAIYRGACGALTPVDCNEDFDDWSTGNYPAALQLSTVVGETYYIVVDGFNLNGNLAEGEFCMFITQFEFIACNAPNVSGGTASSPIMAVCEGQSTNITIEGALAPNEGDLNGYAWVVSTVDLEGNPAFVANQNYAAGLDVLPEPASPLNITPSNYPGVFNPGTTYYFTLVAFGNATWGSSGQELFISQANLDAACIALSNSVQIDYYETESCPVGILDVDETVLGMTIFPNPAQDLINLNINAIQYTEARIVMTNVVGQMIQQEKIKLSNGTNTFSMDVSNAPTGLYLVSIETSSHQSVSKFLKK